MKKRILSVVIFPVLLSVSFARATAPTDMPTDSDTSYSDQLHTVKAKIDEKNQSCVNGDELACAEYKEAAGKFLQVCTLAMQLWCSETSPKFPVIRPPQPNPITSQQ